MRIVSLLPAATEMVCALGLRSSLVGRSHECDSPEDVLELPALTRPRITGSLGSQEINEAVRDACARNLPLFILDEATLEALRPDLVLTQDACAVCAIDAQSVERAAARCTPGARVLSLGPSRLAHVLENIRSVAEAAGVPLRGEQVVADLAARLAALTSVRSGKRVAVLEWLSPPILAGHWGPDLVTAAGGVSCGPEGGAASVVTDFDAIRGLGLDALVVAPCGFSLAVVRREAEPMMPVLRSLAPRLLFLDGSLEVNRPGPRLVGTAEALSRWLQGLSPEPPEDLSTSR